MSGMGKGDCAEVEEEEIGNSGFHGVCSICLKEILLQETALVKGCEHAYCVSCILRWASCKKDPTCPQCKTRFQFLNIHRALDGSICDYMFEESVCLLLRASWFKPLVEVEKEELEKMEEDYNHYEEEDEIEEYYFSSSPSPHTGNRPRGNNGCVSPSTDVGPSHRQLVKLVGRRAKRALKREAADKGKHEQPLAGLDRK